MIPFLAGVIEWQSTLSTDPVNIKHYATLEDFLLSPHISLPFTEDKAMSQHTAAIPTVTAAEQVFLRHFNAETFHARRGPAVSWLDQHVLDWNGMAVFQRWGALHDERSVLGIDDDPLPPFEAPWLSREEFLARVQELLEVYPDLKPLILSIKVGSST
jgi:hypothetical protein